MKKSRSDLSIQAQTIATEVSEEANTASRIGSMDQDIIDSYQHLDDPPLYPPVHIHYADIPGMLNDQGNQKADFFYFVNSAAAAGIDGHAYYEYKGVANDLLSDYNFNASENLKPQNYIDLVTQGSPPPYVPGRSWFDGVNFNKYDNIPGTSLQANKEIVIPVYNNDTVVLTNFTVVRWNTVVGGIPAGQRALADTVNNANGLAVITHNIAVSTPGKATLIGEASGDTSAWGVNDPLFLSGTTAGEMTNVEQEISSLVARVLVADTEANGGKIYIYPQGVIDLTAFGRVAGSGQVQTIGTTPEIFYGFDLGDSTIRTTVTQTQSPVGGENGYNAVISPESAGVTGFYRLIFNVSMSSTSNKLHTFEIYIDGVASTPLLITQVDLTNASIDYGNGTIIATSPVKLNQTSTVEVYCYVNTGTSLATINYAWFEIDRLGNV